MILCIAGYASQPLTMIDMDRIIIFKKNFTLGFSSNCVMN